MKVVAEFEPGCQCEILCLPCNSQQHRCYTVRHQRQHIEKETKYAKFSANDLSEWLKYMAALRNDVQNVHQSMRFIIYASQPGQNDSEINFGSDPEIAFSGTNVLEIALFLLLKNDAALAALSGKRPMFEKKLRALRNDPYVLSKLIVDANGSGIVVDTALIQHVVQLYEVKMIQGVMMRIFR